MKIKKSVIKVKKNDKIIMIIVFIIWFREFIGILVIIFFIFVVCWNVCFIVVINIVIIGVCVWFVVVWCIVN